MNTFLKIAISFALCGSFAAAQPAGTNVSAAAAAQSAGSAAADGCPDLSRFLNKQLGSGHE